MNSKLCLILFGALVTLAVLSVAERTEENRLSEEAASSRLARAADEDPGKSKGKKSKIKNNKTNKKDIQSNRKNKKASGKSVSAVIVNDSSLDCFGFFTDSTASRIVDPGWLPYPKTEIVNFGDLEVTTAVFSCRVFSPDYNRWYPNLCGYDASIDFMETDKQYIIGAATLNGFQNCIITQHPISN